MTDLVKRSKKGDKTAFALLMDAHRQLLYNTALLMLHQEEMCIRDSSQPPAFDGV